MRHKWATFFDACLKEWFGVATERTYCLSCWKLIVRKRTYPSGRVKYKHGHTSSLVDGACLTCGLAIHELHKRTHDEFRQFVRNNARAS